MRTLRLAVALALTAAVTLADAPMVRAEPELLDSIVAVVDDEIILSSHLDRTVRGSPQLQEAIQSLGPSATEQQLEQKLKEIREVVLGDLIDTVLIKREATKYQIVASEADIQRYLQNLAQGNGFGSVAELRNAVLGSGEFENWEEYRADVRDQITVYKATSALANWAVTEAQMREYYRKMSRGEDARIDVERFTFVPQSSQPGDRDAAYASAQKVARRLRAGESSDTMSRELGLDMVPRRTIARGEIAPQLEDALFAASAGEVVGPLASGQGWVVFRVVRHKESDVVSYEQAKEGIRNTLEAEAFAKAERELRSQLRSKAHIDIRL
ncbi:MAG: peptidylprolyl isomerase [Nannocystaceae bacterium]